MIYQRVEVLPLELQINGELYFIQSGSEILEQMLDKICR